MTRDLRALRYDIGPDALTRPDTVPGVVRFAEDSVSSASLEPRAMRELAPYPAVRPLSDESTVVYPLSQAVTSGVAHGPAERIATPTPVELRSGPRHQLASTVPPPSRTRLKQPAVNESARPDEPTPHAGRISTHSAARTEAPVKRGRGFLLGAVLVTAIAAGALGATLGNGSLQHAVETLERVLSGPAAAPLAPSVPARSRFLVPAAPSPRFTATATAPGVPVVSFQDLPPVDQDEHPTKEKRARGTRRR